MHWEQTADDLLGALLAMVPDTYRSLAEGAVRAQAEGYAAERGRNGVEPDDVVRGWIATTPADQRDGLVAVLEELGLDPETYAEELTTDVDNEAAP
jgi:hypothetical protein